MGVTVKNGSKVIEIDGMSTKEIESRIGEIESFGKLEDAQELVALRAEYSYRIYFK